VTEPSRLPVRSSAAIASTSVGDRTRHRVALRLMPFLFVLYVIAFLDRTNISTAALQMPHDLGFDDRVIGLGSGIFFFGYLLLEIPGALIVERWSARRWIARIMVSWGIISVGMAFIRTPHQFYVMRFLLGAAEAGFLPGVIVYLTHWFIYEDRAKAVANLMGAIPLSFVLGSPVSGWLLGLRWMNVSGWRWLFIVEGAPAVVFGVVTWFYLTDWPHQAKWLTEEEQRAIAHALEQEKQAKKASHPYTVWQALRDRKVLTLTAIYFVHGMAAFSFAFWLPTILKRLTSLPNFTVTLLVSLLYLAGFVVMQVNGWHSDRTGERRWHTAWPIFAPAVCLLLIVLFQPGIVTTVILVGLALSTAFGFLPSFWAMPTAFLSESAAAASIGFINCIAMLSGFFGPVLMGYVSSRTSSFRQAFVALAIALFLAGLLALTVKVRRPQEPDASLATPEPAK
jgi:sugar phosphate permease